jgi:D-glycero-alpha-D-manno-heptose-7-phosphate kinase
VLNAAIDRHAYAVIRTLDKPEVHFVASDQQTGKTASLQFPLERDGRLELHTAVYNHMMQHYNGGVPIALELSTFCDAPPGSGLGSSSTLVVTMIRAFVELLNLPLDDYDVAHLAYQIERVDCRLHGGRQDQFSATFGGVNFMEFYEDNKTIVNPLRVKNWILCELEASLVLFFTGVSRESAKIVEEQSNRISAGESDALEAMHELKREAITMKECLLRADFGGIVDSMRRGWESKKKSADVVSNPHIEDIYETAISAGARAGKVSGAGGGGFMLFFTPTERRMDVIRALSRFKGQISNCHFTKNGSQAWRIG